MLKQQSPCQYFGYGGVFKPMWHLLRVLFFFHRMQTTVQLEQTAAVWTSQRFHFNYKNTSILLEASLQSYEMHNRIQNGSICKIKRNTGTLFKVPPFCFCGLFGWIVFMLSLFEQFDFMLFIWAALHLASAVYLWNEKRMFRALPPHRATFRA